MLEKISKPMAVPSVEQEQNQEPVLPMQDDDRNQIAINVWDNFRRRRDNRNRILPHWRHDENHQARNCVQYWNDSEKRANSFSVKPDWKEEYQSNVFNGVTNAKLMIYVAQHINQESKLEFKPAIGHNKVLVFFAKFFQEIYNYIFGVIINEKLDKLKRALYCLTFGTVIIKTDYNPKRDKFVRKIRPLEDIYPENLNVFDIQEQTGLTDRNVITYSEFTQRFKDWTDVEMVPRQNETREGDERVYNVTEDVIEQDKVEILMDYDKVNKKYHVTANGVLITPTESSFPKRWTDEDGEGVLPFSKAVFEIIAVDFFYGRSLPDKLQNMQDTDNKLWNMMLDQMMLAINPPLLVGMGDDDVMGANYHYPGATWQLMQPEKAQWLKGGEPGNAVFKAINDIEGSMDRLSNIDPSQQAVAGGNKTATEVNLARQSGDVIAGLFNFMMDNLESDLATITVPQIKQAIGSPKLKIFVTENVKMINPLLKGEFGTRVLQIESKDFQTDEGGEIVGLKDENRAIEGRSEIFKVAKKILDKFPVRIVSITDRLGQQEKKAKKSQFATIMFGSLQDERREKAIGIMAEEAGLPRDEWEKEMSEDEKTKSGLPPEMQNAIGQQTPGNSIPTLKQQMNQAV